jgi:broad specificity phosphatase PhoE
VSRHSALAMPTENQELAPPWRAYPGQPPWWGGWRQGESEAWLMQRWMPFWRSLSAAQRSDYLQRWEPPDEDWREYVTERWV